MRDRRDNLTHLDLMLCGRRLMLRAFCFDGVAFDPFSFEQDGPAAPEVDVGWRQVADTLVIAASYPSGRAG